MRTTPRRPRKSNRRCKRCNRRHPVGRWTPERLMHRSATAGEKEVRERRDIRVRHPVKGRGHDRIPALALAVAVGPHFRGQIGLALRGQPRDLVLAFEVGKVAHAAAQCLGALPCPAARASDRACRSPSIWPAASRSARQAALISASFIPCTTGSICGEGRSCSRISTSWFSMKSFGCPAIEGIRGVGELPPGPWQASAGSCAASRASGEGRRAARLPTAPPGHTPHIFFAALPRVP